MVLNREKGDWNMRKYLIRFIGIICGIGAILVIFTKLLMPTWFSWNTDNTVKGIYKEPENSIQVLFLGTSSTVTGISPIRLYNKYGYCAYNLATPGQPLLSSYFWLQEVERLHPKSLNTVVLDSYFLFNGDASFESNEKALAYMKLSPIKKKAYEALAEHYGDMGIRNYLFPLFAYHSRWAQVDSDDIDGLTGERNDYSTRGQQVSFNMACKTSDPSAIEVPNYGITSGSDYSEEEYLSLLDGVGTDYLEKIKDFCRDHGLNLVLTGMPHPGYWNLHHDALQYYADKNDIAFIDFNLSEVRDEAGLDLAYDLENPTHMNYWGAEKITDHIGMFLKESCPIEDIRSRSDYAFLARQAEAFSVFETTAQMLRCESLDDFLALIRNDRYTVFLSLKDGASAGMNASVREAAAALGFRNLADLAEGVPYIGIRDRGKVLVDVCGNDPRDIIIARGEIDTGGNYSLTDIYSRTASDGKFSLEKNAGSFLIAGTGKDAGDYSGLSIDGAERSGKKPGLNFAVYDNVLKTFLGSAGFDTSSAECRRTDLGIPPLYQKRLEQEKLRAAGSFPAYIETAADIKGGTLFIIGNMSGSVPFLQPEDISRLHDRGFIQSQMINSCPYIAVMRDGRAAEEHYFDSGEEILSEGTEPVLFRIVQSGEDVAVYIGSQKKNVESSTVYAAVLLDDTVINDRVFR